MNIKRTAQLFCLLLPPLAHAGGFQINTQGIKAVGMGGAYTGICKDASGVYFNPGSMGLLEKNSITLGAAFIMPSASYLNPYGGNVDMKKQTFVPPQLYANYKINTKFTVGLSVNVPYGLGTKWENDWTGRYVSQAVNLKAFYIQPTASYNITNNLGIGAGFVFVSGHANVQKAQQAGNTDIHAELDGGGSGFGYNIGMFAKLGEKARVGIDYHSMVGIDVKNGDATFSNVPASVLAAGDVPSSTKFNSHLDLPSLLSIGLSYQVMEKLLVTFQFDYTGWGVFDSLNFDFPDYESLNSHNGRNYKNASAFRLGAEYKFTSKLNARIGAALDQTPVQDDYVSPELPDADKQLLTAGVSYMINKKFTVDLGYTYENLNERKGTYAQESFTGSYKTKVNIVAVGLNFTW